MSFPLIPALHGNNWWSVHDYPTSIRNALFDDGLEERKSLSPLNYWDFIIRPRIHQSTNSSGKSEVVVDNKEFKVFLNVSQFKPEELEVKIVGNFVVVHGKHEETCDAHGFIAREFTRKYMLPKDCKQENLTATFTLKNILVIQAPKEEVSKEVPPVLVKEETEEPKSVAQNTLPENEKIAKEFDAIKDCTFELSKKSQEICQLLAEFYKKL